jgi:hypothetical protein
MGRLMALLTNAHLTEKISNEKHTSLFHDTLMEKLKGL